jgi:hypothetical protein
LWHQFCNYLCDKENKKMKSYLKFAHFITSINTEDSVYLRIRGGGVTNYKSISCILNLCALAGLSQHYNKFFKKTFIIHSAGQRPVSNSVGHRPTENDVSHPHSPERALAIQSANALTGQMLLCAFFSVGRCPTLLLRGFQPQKTTIDY